MDERENDSSPSGPVKVTIFGQTYSLRSRVGDERTLQAARFLDERMRQIASQLTVHDVAKVAILAALNFADEVRALRAYYDEALAEPSLHAEAQQGAEDESPPRSEDARAAMGESSWFDAIFDADTSDEDDGGSDRMGSQLASKLQGLRRPRR